MCQSLGSFVSSQTDWLALQSKEEHHLGYAGFWSGACCAGMPPNASTASQLSLAHPCFVVLHHANLPILHTLLKPRLCMYQSANHLLHGICLNCELQVQVSTGLDYHALHLSGRCLVCRPCMWQSGHQSKAGKGKCALMGLCSWTLVHR